MNENEKEEPEISKEFSLEIEKYAKLEGLSPEEFTQQTIKDRLEKLKNLYPNIEALCPSGCGTKLVKHKFVNVFDEKGAVSLKDSEEDLYCPKCGIRWIAEQHSPLNTDETKPEIKTEKIEYETIPVAVPKLVMNYLRKTETNVDEALQYAIVDHVRAEMEAMTGLEYIDLFDLKPVFYKTLDDERFKPEE